MNNDLFEVPIYLNIFNRADLTRKVFAEIQKIRPRKLFITADGPRKNIKSDKNKCIEARLILKEIDWECEVFTNFSKDNKGSYKSAIEGISWVFKHVDRAIILEDDCIPHFSFFRYCQELLDYYEDDKRIALISGNNFQPIENKIQYSYYFSRYSHIWGWATWKSSWDKVDFNMQHWPKFKQEKGLDSVYCRKHEREYWYKFYQDMYKGKVGPHWDYQFLLSTYMNNSVSILPSTNLISNIGFGSESTNCKTKSSFQALSLKEMRFPLDHPPFLCRNVAADDFTEKKIYSGGGKTRFKRKIISYLPKKVDFFLRRVFYYLSR
jgi:hypothetical protein